jgi:chromate transporter
MLELILEFLTVGAIAFGGGQAALPLVERIAVSERAWLSPQQFALGVGLSYATPGPVLILAAFVGYYAAGIPGALAATAAVFAVPVFLAASTAGFVQRLSRFPAFRAFGRYAGAAAIGLLAVTLVSLARPVVEVHWVWLLGAVIAWFAERRGFSPIGIIVVALAIGATLSQLFD